MDDFVTIGVPVLAILFGILLNQRGLEKLDARIDKVNGELSARIDKTYGELSARIDKTHAELSGRMDRMQSELTGRIDRIQADLLQFYRILGEHGADIARLKDDRRKP